MDVMAATEYLARSTTFTSVGIIGYIIIGGLAGALASKIIKGSGAGILMDIVIGIIGVDRRLHPELLRQHRGRRPDFHLLHRAARVADPALDRRHGASHLTALNTLRPWWLAA